MSYNLNTHPSQLKVQDIMEVKLSANKHSVLYLPLARTNSLAQTAKESGHAAAELCLVSLVFMLQAFVCVCVY